jgi:hypothetical protein
MPVRRKAYEDKQQALSIVRAEAYNVRDIGVWGCLRADYGENPAPTEREWVNRFRLALNIPLDMGARNGR